MNFPTIEELKAKFPMFSWSEYFGGNEPVIEGYHKYDVLSCSVGICKAWKKPVYLDVDGQWTYMTMEEFERRMKLGAFE